MLPYFEAMNDLAMSAAIRESLWMVAVINTLHLLSLVMFVGAVLIVDLRLIGRGLSDQPIADLAADAQPWLIAALIGLTLTGIPQFLSNALREYHSYLFWSKMATLLVALAYTFTLRRRLMLRDETRGSPRAGRLAGFVSIALWTAVVVQARLIGLFT
jgi:hypothetical protein